MTPEELRLACLRLCVKMEVPAEKIVALAERLVAFVSGQAACPTPADGPELRGCNPHTRSDNPGG